MARRSGSNSRFPWKTLILILGGLALVAVTVTLVRTVPGLQRLIIRANTGGFTVEVGADGRLEVTGFLDEVSADAVERDRILKWAKANLGAYALTDGDLVDGIVGECPEELSADIRKYQRQVESCEQHKVVGPLRQLAIAKKAPFQRRAKQVTIGTPRTGQPEDGRAFTCFDGEWENQRVRLLVEGTARELEVVARGGYDCLPGQDYPDLQINARGAVQLFGRPTREEERAIAVSL